MTRGRVVGRPPPPSLLTVQKMLLLLSSMAISRTWTSLHTASRPAVGVVIARPPGGRVRLLVIEMMGAGNRCQPRHQWEMPGRHHRNPQLSSRDARQSALAGCGNSGILGQILGRISAAWRAVGDVRCAVGM